MSDDHGSRGTEATQKLYQDFVKLLKLLGHGHLLFNDGANKIPSAVPEACEKTNVEVSELLSSMKVTLNEMRKSYNYCSQLMKIHEKNILSLDVMTSQKIEMEVDKSPEHLQLKQQLKQKNADLKHLIDEIQTIFTHINQLVSV